MELRAGDTSIRLTDAAHIKRLNDIYSNAHWERYWHTLPASASDGTITLHSDSHELRRLSCTGTLWEIDAYDDVRTARLDSNDRRWLVRVLPTYPTRTTPASHSMHVSPLWMVHCGTDQTFRAR